ncbi:hypothetical protein ACJJI5_12490 [Microbulbifer sp. EKSA008]|uniref:hypothetical protein n=1 Tax=Microbulbifer sp. EKSA008 TaxID=3243367 RepID=UPI004041D9DF
MRKIIVNTFISLDGVMQAPGGPEEDSSGGFELGGWVASYFDEGVGEFMGNVFAAPFELLLGHRTHNIFAAHWPKVAADPPPEGVDESEIQLIKKSTVQHDTWLLARDLSLPGKAASGWGMTQSQGFVQSRLAMALICWFQAVLTLFKLYSKRT